MKPADLFALPALTGPDAPPSGPVDLLPNGSALLWPLYLNPAEVLSGCDPLTPDQVLSLLPILGESIDDAYILKAVFVVGAGGSGKSTIAREMFAGRGLKLIDQDRHLERFVQAGAAWDKQFGPSYDTFKKAQALARKERDQYAEQRLGLVIDATGWEFRRVAEPVAMLRELGYDCSMVFVSTSLDTAFRRNDARSEQGGRDVPDYAIEKTWRGVHENLTRYRLLFGARNLVVVKNDKDITPETWQETIAPYLYRLGGKLLDRPLRNPVGRAWVRKQIAGWKMADEDRPTIVVPGGLFDDEDGSQ